MRTSGTTGSSKTTGGTGSPRRRWAAAHLAALCLVLGACTSAPDSPPAPAGSASPTRTSTAGPTPTVGASTPATADALTVTITEADGNVTPNGKKLDARVGQQVVLQVTSDQDDEIHAHVGGDGYELEVEAGKPATGTFTLDSAGSFEVESHRLEKVIVILNAR